MNRVALLALAAVGMGAAAPAHAGGVEEVKVGALAHNICITNCKNADKEDGPVVDIQVNFKSPGFLGWAFSPQPYVAIAPNVSGDTSFAAVGLEWTFEFADGWAFVPGFGYAVHDGEVKNKFPNGTPQALQFSQDNVLYGSRDLFRTTFALQREFGDRWTGEVVYAHYSHGQILGSGRNQGTDQAGVRIGYRFGG
ncbi:MAG: acyloxyacyl hydrolase [Hyphomonadaceae bacterium]|nr:acyloxyacyl hydrolase [Hyphomonadaceae bacterium]